jgi:hypothetical protein
MPTSFANPTHIIPFYYNDVTRTVMIAVSDAAGGNIFEYVIVPTAQITTDSTQIQPAPLSILFIKI